MAGLGYVVPQGQDSKESFHALRRTTEGLLYYTKVNKNGFKKLGPAVVRLAQSEGLQAHSLSVSERLKHL